MGSVPLICRVRKEKLECASDLAEQISREMRKAAAGFEPANNGFAIRPLEPLGYAADNVGFVPTLLFLLSVWLGRVKERCDFATASDMRISPGRRVRIILLEPAFHPVHRIMPMAEAFYALNSSTSAGHHLPVTRAVVDGDTTKFCQTTHDGYEIESVVIPMGARENTWRTLCVSTQVGCARACTFCQTGRMGLLRNLTVEEIVGQAVAARRELGFDVRNVVFMGMGEPMDNLDNVIRAIELFHGDRANPIARRRITVSTVGKCAGIRRLAELKWRRLGLAVSLNAPNDEIRSQIMPINRTEPMAMLREAIRDYPVRAGGHVLIEYVVLRGINDRIEHALELADYLRGLPTCVNLIPWNPIEGIAFETPDEEVVDAFQQTLMDQGQLAFRRNTKGRTAMGACGQLGNLALQRKRKAEVTIGLQS